MKCREVKKILEEFAEGKTIKDENALRHMRECPACAEEFDVIKKMKAAFREKEKVNIPLDFNDMVWLRLKEQPPMTWQRAIKPIFQRPLVPQLAAAAIAVVLILVFGIRFSTNTQGQKFAQANKPAPAVTEKKMPALQTAAQPKKKEAAAKEQQAAVKQVETKKQETAVNKITQAKQDTVAQYEAGQPAPRIAMAAAGKQANASSAQQQPGTAVEDGKSVSALDIQKTPTVEENNANLQIKNNVINPEKGESVTIQYTVAQPSEILIKVYDRRGETIKTIESGFRQSGTYYDSWNGEDDSGAQVSAGIYVIYVKTGFVQAKRKVCIVK